MKGRLEMGEMSVTLDDEGCAYVRLGREPIAPGEVARSQVLAESVVVDYDSEGNLLGVEVIGPEEEK